MILGRSNILEGVTPTITLGGASTDAPVNITDPDFSNFYESSTDTGLEVSFGATSAINYVGLAGMNLGSGDYTSYALLKDNGTEVQRIYVNSDQHIVFNFESRSFTNLQVFLFVSGVKPILNYAQAGIALTVPNSGEQAGYERGHLTRNYKNRVTLNNKAEPVAVVRTRVEQKGRLNIPNATRDFAEGEWQDFLEFVEQSPFFILERPLELITEGGATYKAESAYLGYDVKATSKAHSRTRLLVNLGINFRVNNGL